MYRSEIRPSQIDRLLEKAKKSNYQKYLSKLVISRCRAFKDATIVFQFPVTALIGPNKIGEKLGFINEEIIRSAFLMTWCEQYPGQVNKFLSLIMDYLPKTR